MSPIITVAVAVYLACGCTAARDMEFPEAELAGRLPRWLQAILITLVWPYCVYRVYRDGWLP